MTGLVGKLLDVNCGDLIEFETRDKCVVAGYLTQFSTHDFILSPESPFNHETDLFMKNGIIKNPFLRSRDSNYSLCHFETYRVLKKRE